MAWEVWLTFIGAAVLIAVSPGAGAIQSMATGLTHGVRRGYWSILGAAAALDAHSAAADGRQPHLVRPVRHRRGGAVVGAPRRHRVSITRCE